MTGLKVEHLHKLGQAVAIAALAISDSVDELRTVAKREGLSHEHVAGEVAQIALARYGLVVSYDPARARLVEAEAEHSEAPRMS